MIANSIYLLLLFVAFSLGIIRFNKLTTSFRLLTAIIGFALVTELAAKFFGIRYKNSLWTQHLYIVVESIIYSLMYYNLFTSKLLKKYTIAAILIIVIFELINIIFFQSIKQFPSNTLDVVYCIYITYTLLYLKQMMLKPTEEKLYAQSAFLFTVSLVFFTCCMFIFYTLENYFYKNHISFAPLLIVNYAANYIFYLTAGIAILIDKKVYKSNFI